MNKLYLISLFFILLTTPASAQEIKISADLNKSFVKWKGTKLNYTGKHEGTIGLASGFLVFKDQLITGGEFRIRMDDIKITDIPASDVIPIRNLTSHLKSDFETANYPFSTLKITKASVLQNSTILIEGLLTIKNITKRITFTAKKINSGRYTSSITIDRREWKIGDQASWLEKKLTDPEINFDVGIALK